VISIIIPNYNDARIRIAIDKLCQSSADIEILIIDGKSSNPKVLEYYEQLTDSRVQLIPYHDRGIFDAINHGLTLAKGNIIYLQGSDDVLSDSSIIRKVAEHFDHHPGANGYCVGCKFVDETQALKREWVLTTVTNRKIRMGILPPHFSLFLRRDVYDRVGPFEFQNKGDLALDSLWLVKMGQVIPNLDITVDNDYWLSMALGGLSTGSVSTVLKQNFRLLQMLKKSSWRPRLWFLLPFVKVLSKLRQ